MAMLKGLVGGATGAAAYGTYQTVQEKGDVVKGILELINGKTGANLQTPDVSRLHKQVEDLQAMMLRQHSEKPQTVTIVTGSGKGSWSVVVYPIVVAGGVVLYLRFVRGWRLADMMYVTRSSLQNFKTSVQEGMTKMQDQMKETTESFLVRFKKVMQSQKEIAEQQQLMDEKLGKVDDNVTKVSDSILYLQQDVCSVRNGIEQANHGIMLLCSAVAEVAKRNGGANLRSTRALDTLVKGSTGSALPLTGPPPPVDRTPSARVLGLEGVLQVAASAAAAAVGGDAPSPRNVDYSSIAISEYTPYSDSRDAGLSHPSQRPKAFSEATVQDEGASRRNDPLSFMQRTAQSFSGPFR